MRVRVREREVGKETQKQNKKKNVPISKQVPGFGK